ncbi:MAG TPA: AI-2E family transporter [Chitinophagaceae bacterium]|nr:AI-2E family transporter [Chitinophagaceae bacterium]
MRENRSPYILRLASILIVLFLITAALFYMKVVFVPLLFSIIFAVMLYPFSQRFEKFGLSKGLASFATVFIATICLVLLAYLILRQVSIFLHQIPQLSEKTNKIIENVQQYATRNLKMKKTNFADTLQLKVTELPGRVATVLGNSLPFILRLLIDIFLIPLYVFFLLYYRHFFLEFSYKVFPESEKSLIDETLEKLEVVIKGYIFGQFLDIIIIGAVNTVVLYLLGVGYTIVLGFGLAFLCIVPYLGMIVGSIAAIIVAILTTNTTWQPVTAFCVLWVIHVIDSNIVAPNVIGSRISINPLVAIFILFLFGELWGLAGLFLAFPLAAILKVIFDTIPGLKSYGFLLGEPQKYHLKKYSLLHIKRLQSIQEMKEQTPMSEVLPGEPGADPLPGDGESPR